MAYRSNNKYPFSDGHQGKTGTKHDHVISGAKELIQLLDGQETVVKQNVISRVAKLHSAPFVNSVRTMIMQEAQLASV